MSTESRLAAWLALLSHWNRGGANSALKFLLADAILSMVGDKQTSASRVDVAESMLRRAYPLVKRFRLRLDKAGSAPLVQTIVEGLPGRHLREVPQEHLLRAARDLARKGLNEPVRHFHNLRDMNQVERYFDCRNNQIVLRTSVIAAIEPVRLVFGELLSGAWARWTERVSIAPRIGRKISLGERDESRSIPASLRRLLAQTQDVCFYCGKRFDGKAEPDHLIPWAYVVEHEFWNLVPACRACNRDPEHGKWDALPDDSFLTSLIERNARYQAIDGDLGLTMSRSLLTLGVDSDRQVNVLRRIFSDCALSGFPTGWQPTGKRGTQPS